MLNNILAPEECDFNYHFVSHTSLIATKYSHFVDLRRE